MGILDVVGGTEYGSESGPETLTESQIADVVGPGALGQPLDPASAREAAKRFSNVAAPTSYAEQALDQQLGNVEAQESALRAAAQQFGVSEGGAIGNYYGDLRTGQVMAGPQIPEDSRIGPFHSAALAKAAIMEARNKFSNPD